MQCAYQHGVEPNERQGRERRQRHPLIDAGIAGGVNRSQKTPISQQDEKYKCLREVERIQQGDVRQGSGVAERGSCSKATIFAAPSSVRRCISLDANAVALTNTNAAGTAYVGR